MSTIVLVFLSLWALSAVLVVMFFMSASHGAE